MSNIYYKKNFIYFYIFFLLIFPKIAQSENIDPLCNGLEDDNQIKLFINYRKKEIDFNKLEIDIRSKNYRKWIENVFKAYEDRESFSNLRIKKKYKKNFNARLKVKFNDNFICTFKAKIKIHGSFIDHLSPTNNNTSLQVKIIDGNIYGIEEFILFKPASRNGINEVFINFLMEEMGFIAPQTAFIKAKVDGKVNNFVFQEKINKNMLERRGLRESIILSADDRIRNNYSANNNLALAKIDNIEWSVKNYDNFVLSSRILSEFNEVYLINNAIKYYKIYPTSSFYLNLHISNLVDRFHDIDLFELSTIIFDGGHALASHNRVFYYDYYNNKYLPILYDAQPKIFKNKKFKNIDLKNEHTWSNFFEINENHLKQKDEFIKRFKTIEENNDVLKKINRLGIFINDQEIKNIFALINQRLNLIQNYPSKKISFYNEIKDKINQKKIFYLNDKKYMDDYTLVFIKNNNEFLECDISFYKCEDLDFINKFIISDKNKKELKKSLNKNGKKIFIGNENLRNSEKFSNNKKYFSSFKNKFISKDGKINFIYNDIKFQINEIEKKISFFSKNEKVIFLNSHIEDWSIIYSFSDDILDKNIENYNNSYITGCLNFFNSNMKNIKIKIENTYCEDALNVVSSKGDISPISILNSQSDALDFDFSNIRIQNLYINNSSNDCLDFSYGNYYIDNIYLSNCGDKAISVGENSFFENKISKIVNSKNGVVVKDSSKAMFEKIIFNNIKFNCFMTYRKKNEFAGGYLLINSFDGNCENKAFKQTGSILNRWILELKKNIELIVQI